MTVEAPAPATSSEGYFKPRTNNLFDADDWDDFSLADQAGWLDFRHPYHRSAFGVLRFLLAILVAPGSAPALVRHTGRLYWDTYLSDSNSRGVGAGAVTADEVVRYERETATMLRRLCWMMAAHYAVAVIAIFWTVGAGGTQWVVTAWMWVNIIQMFWFVFSADRLAADIRLLHAEFYAVDRSRFPYGRSHRCTFLKV